MQAAPLPRSATESASAQNEPHFAFHVPPNPKKDKDTLLKLLAQHSTIGDERVLLRFSQDIPHIPRVSGLKSRCYNNDLVGRTADLHEMAALMASANRRCFGIEWNPSEPPFEGYLRELVTVEGLETIADCGRYYMVIRYSPLHSVETLCVAVTSIVRKYFYPDYRAELLREPQHTDDATGNMAPAILVD